MCAALPADDDLGAGKSLLAVARTKRLTRVLRLPSIHQRHRVVVSARDVAASPHFGRCNLLRQTVALLLTYWHSTIERCLTQTKNLATWLIFLGIIAKLKTMSHARAQPVLVPVAQLTKSVRSPT